MNIDCEIYIKNFVTFFDNNPNDLRNLIGNVEKDIFYDKVRNAVYKKCDEGDDYILTQQELLKILVDIYNQHIKRYSFYTSKLPFDIQHYKQHIVNILSKIYPEYGITLNINPGWIPLIVDLHKQISSLVPD